MPNHPTICSRVTLSMCSKWRNSVLCFNELQQSDIVNVFNMEELFTVLWWLCPVEEEGLHPDDHHGALRVRYLIWSVLQGNRGKKPIINEGPFLRRNPLNIPGGLWHLCKREVALTPLRRPGHIWGWSVRFDSAHQLSKLCDNFLVPGAYFGAGLLNVRSVSSCYLLYCCIPTPGQSGGLVIFMLPAFI